MHKFLPSFFLLIAFFCNCISIFEVNAATYNCGADGDCDRDEIVALIAAAANGDTINVVAGSFTWSSYVPITKPLTIKGQTVCTRNDTTFVVSCVDGTTLNGNGFKLEADDIRITGLTFTDDGDQTACRTIGALTGFRIDHNKFDYWAKVINKAGGGLKQGLIDHNLVVDCGTESFYIVGEGNGSWAQGGALGDDYPEGTVYIEDNYFTTPSRSVENMFDTGGGGRYVFRYNRMSTNEDYNFAIWLEGHGHQYNARDENDNAGTYGVEIYENIFNVINTRMGTLYKGRGGRGYVYNNTITDVGFSSRTVGFLNMESDPDEVRLVNFPVGCQSQYHEDAGYHAVPLDPEWMCNADDGTPPSDYPCPLQINNFYIFNNTSAGYDIRVGCRAYYVNYIVEDRDYYDDCGDGDTNFTSDVAASRPGTCTTDDCYWETDNKKLYRCTSTNVWTLVYEPYEYPHPLNKP